MREECTPSDADHDGHWRGQTESTWARNNKHRDRVDDGMGNTRCRTKPSPTDEVQYADGR